MNKASEEAPVGEREERIEDAREREAEHLERLREAESQAEETLERAEERLREAEAEAPPVPDGEE